MAAGLLLAANLLAASAQATTYEIDIKNMKYGAAPQHLLVGDTIRWKNDDIFRHTATVPGEFDADLKPGSSADTVLRRAGTQRVTCRFHPTMTLQLVVAGKVP